MTASPLIDSAPLDEIRTVRAALAETNAQIVDVKRALRHRHDDDAWWASWGEPPAAAQREREWLRGRAHVSHVFLASSRGRIHGGFASLDEQRAWLAKVRR